MVTSNVDSVVKAITDAVRAGRLVPGARLVEADYTQDLGFSRSTVREAFQRLVSTGLLTFERHRGVSVCKMSRKQARDIYRVRAALEGLAARLATPHAQANPSIYLTLQDNLDAAVENADLNSFSKLNSEFHCMIAQNANNEYLHQAIRRFETSIFWLQFRVLIGQNVVFLTNDDHRVIVDAMISGDADTAEKTMVRHVEYSCELAQTLADDFFKTEE